MTIDPFSAKFRESLVDDETLIAEGRGHRVREEATDSQDDDGWVFLTTLRFVYWVEGSDTPAASVDLEIVSAALSGRRGAGGRRELVLVLGAEQEHQTMSYSTNDRMVDEVIRMVDIVQSEDESDNDVAGSVVDTESDAAGSASADRRRKWLIGAACALGLVVAVSAATFGVEAMTTTSTVDISGTMILLGQTGHGGDPCSGSGGYDDVDQGTSVTIENGKGEVISTSLLGEGRFVSTSTSNTGYLYGRDSGSCVFQFTAQGVPESSFYGIEVSHRGKLTYSSTDLKKAGYSVALTLGS